MAHYFIFLRLSQFGLLVYPEECWFESSVSQLRVLLSAEGVKNISQPYLSILRRYGSVAMTFTSKLLYMYICIYIYIIYIYVYIHMYIYIIYLYSTNILWERIQIQLHRGVLKSLGKLTSNTCGRITFLITLLT